MLLSAEHLSINFGSRQLLDDVNFYLNEGDKVGVIGINGTGKSTFLKVLSGVTEPDGGTISRNPNVQISLLPQNPVMDEDATVLEQVFLHFPAEFRALNEYEAKAMLNRLGITDFTQKVGTLSGGQRKRVALAAALIHPADVLILDEPTNHLDSEMVAWLEDWLRRFKGGLVMVTHDRYFLERVVNHITELSRGKLYHYEANYSKYLELREQRAEMAEASERKRQSILRVEREWIMRGCRARTTKSKERIQRYEALLNQDAPETDEAVQMAAASSRLGKKIIELRDVSKSFDGRPIVSHFSYNLLRRDRIGIVGRNGAGKSTLLHLIAGELAPDSGTVEIGATVKIGHFSQEGRELDLNQRVYDFIHDIADEVKDRRGHLLRQPDDGAVPVPRGSPVGAHRAALRRGAAAAVSAVGADGGPQCAAAGRAHQRPGRHHPLHSGGLSCRASPAPSWRCPTTGSSWTSWRSPSSRSGETGRSTGSPATGPTGRPSAGRRTPPPPRRKSPKPRRSGPGSGS